MTTLDQSDGREEVRSAPMRQRAGDGALQPQGVPNIGEIVKRFRVRRGESLRDVARGTGLSPSFLSLLERGETDITVSRLAAIANHFDHDVGSLLGYSTRGPTPQIIRRHERVKVNRGKGVDYNVVRIPGTELEIVVAIFSPHTALKDEITHEGVDIGLCIQGRIVATVNDVDYPIEAGETAIWSGAYRHTMRNDEDEQSIFVGLVTEQVY
jgi:transcriptional regulator with XRE-family HTH domain